MDNYAWSIIIHIGMGTYLQHQITKHGSNYPHACEVTIPVSQTGDGKKRLTCTLSTLIVM